MGDISNNRAKMRPEPVNLTTRRSFIAVASLGAVSLYGHWAAVGAAPLRFWEQGEPTSRRELDDCGHTCALLFSCANRVQ